MPDEFGNVLPEDLANLQAELLDAITQISESIASEIGEIRNMAPIPAVVVAHAEKGSEEEGIHGIGSVQVILPMTSRYKEDHIWARPKRQFSGNFDIPKIGTTVFLDMFYGGTMLYLYTSLATMEKAFFENSEEMVDYEFSQEGLGFTDSLLPSDGDYIGGRYVDKVLEKPGSSRIYLSSKNFLLFEDEDAKKAEFRTGEGYELIIGTGATGKIYIGQKHQVTDDSTLSSSDIEINSGMSGKIEITANTGLLQLETTQGNIKLLSSLGDIDMETSTGDIKMVSAGGKILLEASGENVKSILDALVDAITTSKYPTAVGSSGTVDNPADYASVKSRLALIFS